MRITGGPWATVASSWRFWRRRRRYLKWVEAQHPNTPEEFQRFVQALRPVEMRIIRRRAAALRAFSAEVEQIAAKVAQEKRQMAGV
ncbi:MAG TPA: hypothetical protein VFA27_10365 [Vicinamibacterales bacterium]|nr:hypothetical protein [Vicinamibacterales bacterium]